MQPKIVRPASAPQTYCPDPPHFPQSPSRDKNVRSHKPLPAQARYLRHRGKHPPGKSGGKFSPVHYGQSRFRHLQPTGQEKNLPARAAPGYVRFPCHSGTHCSQDSPTAAKKSSGLTEIMTVFVSYSNVIPRSRISFISEQTASTSSAASTKASGYFPERVSSRAKSSI